MRHHNRIIRFAVILLMVLVCLLSVPASATEPPTPPSAQSSSGPSTEPPAGPTTGPTSGTYAPPSATASGLSGLSGAAGASATASALPSTGPDAGSSTGPSAAPPPPGGPPAGGPSAAAVGPTAAAVPAPRVYNGWAFDTCQTPSVATMRAWLASKYRAVGVYYGGRARACAQQPNLTTAWLRSVSAMGWRVIPVYVGMQSPCVLATNKKKLRMSSTTPGTQGTADARDAVARAQELGLLPGSPIYLDMEAYDTRYSRCTRPTLSFVRAFNREVRRQNYLSGFYSSAATGIAHVARSRRNGTKDMPDVIWYARWRVTPTLTREPVMSRSEWSPHRRIHQYAGNVRERHGGRQLNIDRNRVDAPVAIVG